MPSFSKKEIVLQNMETAWKLRTQQMKTQAQIGELMGLSQQHVHRLLSRAAKEHSKAYLKDVRKVKTEQVSRLEVLLSECWEAWFRSKHNTNEDNPNGDPRFIEQFRKLLDDIRKIIGANYVPITQVQGQINFMAMPDEQKIKFFASLTIEQKLQLITPLLEQVKCEQIIEMPKE